MSREMRVLITFCGLFLFITREVVILCLQIKTYHYAGFRSFTRPYAIFPFGRSG